MVIIVTSQTINMQSNPRALRKALYAMWDHLAAQVSDLLSFQAQLDNTEGSVGKVDNGA
jgi:hypothetical protein